MQQETVGYSCARREIADAGAREKKRHVDARQDLSVGGKMVKKQCEKCHGGRI